MTMTDRRIDLNIGLSQGLPDLSQSGLGQPRREAADADRRAFEQAMNQTSADGAPAAAADPAGDTPKPFALFGGPAAPLSGSEQAPAGLAQDLARAADRMLVGDGSTGRREVRLALKDEILPGVTMSVYEEEGRLVAAFVCSREASRERLAACARALADEWAQSVGRPVLVRVSADDPDDPCLTEAAAAA
ncbi:hypothetical protein [Castellaniella sp.]|uniref:hypothetical protein n=1 Tax=Castellaniella sp. TaxID=1955812 RepID=UPI002AFE1CFF|nr:hypothetical protein [Castellaniella sp.]